MSPDYSARLSSHCHHFTLSLRLPLLLLFPQSLIVSVTLYSKYQPVLQGVLETEVSGDSVGAYWPTERVQQGQKVILLLCRLINTLCCVLSALYLPLGLLCECVDMFSLVYECIMNVWVKVFFFPNSKKQLLYLLVLVGFFLLRFGLYLNIYIDFNACRACFTRWAHSYLAKGPYLIKVWQPLCQINPMIPFGSVYKMLIITVNMAHHSEQALCFRLTEVAFSWIYAFF